ncbi:MAG: hypothetical protein MJK18_06605 [Bdellovibrionales bacterium]|nr:hypothetical protein [Bdellovibrionales bacterium]
MWSNIKMLNLTSFFFILVASFQPSWGINYFRCETTDNCAKAYVGCGRYGSVHKRYKELYEAKARKTDTTAFCLAPTDRDKKMRSEGVALCKKSECRLVLEKKKESSSH